MLYRAGRYSGKSFFDGRRPRAPRRGIAQGGFQRSALKALLRGEPAHGTCQRFLLACSVLPAWGEPSRPGLPPEGETEKGEINFLAAAGFSNLVSNAHVPLP